MSRITPRSENFSQWYLDIIKEADLAEHSVVRGCMIIKPLGYALWERVQKILDDMIKKTGHQNVYFPLLIPLKFLEKEARHVEGFAKECAIVTHYRLEADGKGNLVPSENAKLEEPYIIRPTSETVIGEAMSRWVQSYRDLPILINQWCNVMRWEMRTRFFLRTSEFLWQEGHTAHASKEEALEETLKMLDVYETFFQNYLAIPVIKGEKTTGERFPGADNTYTIEAMMQDGKALQAGTSHFLGQNFSKAYNICFSDSNQDEIHAWTTSWGVSTRLIGALIMTHSDNEGLILPPDIAPYHISIIPITKKGDEKASKEVETYCKELLNKIQTRVTYNNEPVRVWLDQSQASPADKFWNAVRKGFPLRIEVGKRDLDQGHLVVSRRDRMAKEREIFTEERFLEQIPAFLMNCQNTLYQRALENRQKATKYILTFQELINLFEKDSCFSGFAVGFFDLSYEKNEEFIESLSRLKLTIRCIVPDHKEGKCLFSGNQTVHQVIFARAY